MTNYASMALRIRKAETLEDLKKLHESLDRLYGEGVLTVSEFRRLDLKILDSQIRFEVRVPNAVTQGALAASRAGEVSIFASVDDLFSDLEDR